MRFVETDKGYVNLDRVVIIDRSGRREEWSWRLIGDEGALGHVIDPDFYPGVAEAVYVSASPADFAWVIDFYDEHRPTAKDMTCQQERVVAWKILHGEAAPVFVEEPVGTVLIPMPDGRVTVPGLWCYSKLNVATVELLAEAQAHWDKEHQKPVTDPDNAA